MAGEFGENRDIEELLASKEGRLPKGIRKYIRRLKEEGLLDRALRVSREQREKRKPYIKREERLQVAVGKILDMKDPKVVVVEAAVATWLLQDGEAEEGTTYDSVARIADLDEIYELNPDLETHLEVAMPEAREEALRIRRAL
ncbi:hypothetical protein A2714_03340 [Candidatus Woesebacteria bacterium RIFCSPHIGHO2_01_FULL_38_9]|uniref:Uncharacterized protein n=1 Tax=Candidatus Woesebacteria bacterium RIFCSPHIGHO2_01_FULL_38_9 TaxID=1802492 RepID=A0A1F7Y2B9_9BACT|nr:MAG: hypothetical protein A2714_03340 [Candidatus Woesebacteria bacterium RIFCSPHIGHO2_01_FULL_38_9]